jgi:hypothetical protein
MLTRYYYSDDICQFLHEDEGKIIGALVKNSEFSVENNQRDAWIEEIHILQTVLYCFSGRLYFEYSIPRMGRRIDVLCIIRNIIYILEFKIGEEGFTTSSLDQVMDYAVDLKNFHKTSHDHPIIPIVIASNAPNKPPIWVPSPQGDQVYLPVKCNSHTLKDVIINTQNEINGDPIDPRFWENGGYSPTPTIIEAATALYQGHRVNEISRSEANAINLQITSDHINQIIEQSRINNRKSICFITGVPGAGKTLVGLNIATKNFDKTKEAYSVFLSGNGPLVSILREALARDKVEREKSFGERVTKTKALSEVKLFIQNVHHFRDECLVDSNPPIEHVVLFDEAQRAWDIKQTSNFMLRKKHVPNFNHSEPEYLISCLNRHPDWAVIICLVGGGQEINTGEAGISEWIASINRSYPDWDVYISPNLNDSEYEAQEAIENASRIKQIHYLDDLHLSVSMRSFRAEKVSLLVKQILDLDLANAQTTYAEINGNYPILLTRSLPKAKDWLRNRARGTERYGIIVSSQAERLRPHAINVKAPMDPIHWFLDTKEDVRSSYYLEDVATEFDIQGLELDWSCVTWDADFRYTPNGWMNKSFVGNKWNHINKVDRQLYQKNAYRVLLTRARQGMVIVVPEGDPLDHTRKPEYYDPTFDYLKEVGFRIL